MLVVVGVIPVHQVATDGTGGGYHGHMRDLQWEFAVIDSPEVNAFVAPGGKVVAYTGELSLQTQWATGTRATLEPGVLFTCQEMLACSADILLVLGSGCAVPYAANVA
jgi:hypothetical protein